MTSEISAKLFKFSNDKRRKGIILAMYIKVNILFLIIYLIRWENIHLLI